MGMVLKVVGGLWALLGAIDVWSLSSQHDLSQTWLGFGVIINFLLFILPGLAVYGLGAAINPHGRRINCPHCDEKISPRANVCPHCRRDVPEIEKETNSNRLVWTFALAPLVAVAVGYHVYELNHPAAAAELWDAIGHGWTAVTGR